MKKYVLLLFFVSIFTLGFAQNITLEPAQIDVEEPLNTLNDHEAHSTVTNPSADTKFFVWERNVLNITNGWESAICDKNRCYFPHVSTAEFELAANEGGDIIAHVYPNQILGEASIEVKISEKDDPNNTITGLYNFALGVSGVLEVEKSVLKVFPNPSHGEINLQLWLDQATSTQVEIQNALGRRVSLKNYGQLSGEQLISLTNENLGTGMYFVVIHLDDQIVTKKVLIK